MHITTQHNMSSYFLSFFLPIHTYSVALTQAHPRRRTTKTPPDNTKVTLLLKRLHKTLRNLCNDYHAIIIFPPTFAAENSGL